AEKAERMNSKSHHRARRVPPSITGLPFDTDGDVQSRALEAIARMLRGRLAQDELLEVLGAAFVAVAVRPYWAAGNDASGAHERLHEDHPALVEAVETLASLLLGR